MGVKSNEIEIEGDKFSDTVREAQRAYRSEEWDKFNKIFSDNTVDLLKDFDLVGNTAINIAGRSDKPEILKELLGKLSEEERWRALRKKNYQGNTLLHEIVFNCKKVRMADIVLAFEETTPLPQEEEEMAELSEEEKKEKEEEKKRPLVEWRNLKGETPVFKAAKFGNLKMLIHLVKRIGGGDMKIHEESRRETILHASLNSQSFDVALWIIMNMDRISLVMNKNGNGLTCLQLLARMPSAFKSHYDPQEFVIPTRLVYKWLPDEVYDNEGCNRSELLGSPLRDLETGGQDDASWPPTRGLLSRINYAVWKRLAKAFKWIESIWEEKTKHLLAERLAKFLVRCDYSWQIPYDESKEKPGEQLPPVLYNVAKKKQELKWKHKKEVTENNTDREKDKKHHTDHTPLLIAANNGITEIINLYLKEHPQSINHVSEDGLNILHIAVEHRQEEILDLLEDQLEFSFLASRVNRENRTALHQVARIDYYRGSPQPGPAFQLQAELNWYKRVEKIVPSHLHLHCDNELLTAGDRLDIDHDQMLADAQTWIKQTAQSCSTVAVLVATVVFAAAYTIPGGNNEKIGAAVLFREPVFIFFTIMDIVALAFSLASVVMFLSILNSPFELWDFHKSLPRKLRVGFCFLFSSLVCTMLAFSATILITIKLPWKQWTSTLVYSAAFFPVTVFALIEFPLFTKITSFFSKLRRKKKKTSICRSNRRV